MILRLLIFDLVLSFSFLLRAQTSLNDSIISEFEEKEYETVIQLSSNLDLKKIDLDISIEAIQCIGRSYFFLEKNTEAIPILKIVLAKNLIQQKHFDAYANSYYIAKSYKNLFNLDSAQFYYEVGVQEAYLTENSQSISSALNNLAILHERRSEYTKALLLFQKSLDSRKNDTIGYMQTRSNISINYHQIGILDSAYSIASEAYNYFTLKEDQKYWKWLSTYRLAYIEKDLKNNLSESYYQELIGISDNDYDLALAEIGLGESMLKSGKDSALYYFEKANRRASKIQNSLLKREVNLNKARIYLQINPNQLLLRDVLDELKTIITGQTSERARSLLNILESKYYLNENSLAKSLNSIDSAINISSRFKHKDRLAEALTQKFKVLNHFGRYKEALEVKEEEIKVREELFNDRSEAVYQILRTQNEMDKQESTIANQQLVIDNNNLQITIMYISIALVISALVFIFWQYRTRSKYAQKLETMFLDSRHRYMNNLLLLKNWFNEGKTEKNDEIISFAQNRIDAISTVNRHLDRLSYNKDTIESKSFLEDISHNLLANREFTSEIQNVPINMSVSGPLGMITNEIITNGLKYGAEPYAIRFHKNGNGYVLEIEDHGPGITDPEKKGTGSKVLRLLSRQLKGELKYQNKADHSPESRGTLVSLNFKG